MGGLFPWPPTRCPPRSAPARSAIHRSAAPAAPAPRPAAGTSSPVTARAAASGHTLRLRTRLIDAQVAIAEEPAIEHLDRLHRFLFCGHFDEAEAARAPGELVGDDPHGLHGSRLRKELPQVLLR